jgi:hypothetical protein
MVDHMTRRNIATFAILAALVCTAAFAPGAAVAGPNEDFSAVGKDYLPDQKITPCAFTREQLVNALAVADTYGNDADYYAPGFRDAIRAEIKRWDDGGCAAPVKKPDVNPAVAVFGSGARLKITVIKARGGAQKESVIFKNIGTRTIPLGGLKVVTNGGRRITLPTYRLGSARSFRVVPGCARKHKKRARVKATIFNCQKKQFLSDKNGLVQLKSSNVVLSQYGYGSFSKNKRF